MALLRYSYAQYVKAIFCQCTSFIEADDIKLTSHVDTLGADAKDLLLLEAGQCKVGADCESSWKRRWHHNRDKIQRSHNDQMPSETKFYKIDKRCNESNSRDYSHN